MEVSKVIIITAVSAICISVIMSAYFTRTRKQEMQKVNEKMTRSVPSGSPIPQNANGPRAQQKKNSQVKQKSKRGGWGSFMLPFYSFGVLAYVVYVVAKIMSRKYSSIRKNGQIKVSWEKERHIKGKTKTKITMHELKQLEQKLQETEAAVQQIFVQTCEAVKAANKTLESSSDEECSTRPTRRLKEMTMPQSSSTDEEANSEPQRQIPVRKLDQTYPKHGTLLRRRKIKRKKRARRGSAGTSDSEPENTISVEHRVSGEFVSSSEEGETLPSDCVVGGFISGSNATNNPDLLRTAKNIRHTMKELQSCIDDRKTELEMEKE